MMKRIDLRKTGWFVAVTFLLVAVIAFCIAGTVASQSAAGGEEVEFYYREQELEMRQQTIRLLEERGFRNSGVTLTRVVDSEGNRSYTFTIHHGTIDRMTEEERTELAAELAGNTLFTGKLLCDASLADKYSFCHEFLFYE